MPIPGKEKYYHVSNYGRVKSLERISVYYINGFLYQRKIKESILKASPDQRGYPRVSFCQESGLPRYGKVHKLVAEAFIGPIPENCTLIRHLDNNPLNNAVVNLKYGTYLENAQDKTLAGTHNNTIKNACIRGHKLYGKNLIPSVKLNSRGCLSCSRMQAWIKYRIKNKGLFYSEQEKQKIADEYYDRIIL